MSSRQLLLRASDLIGRPVVTIDQGEDVAEVKDVVYGTAVAAVLGFTLNRRGFLGGPMRRVLAWADVAAVGRHAVMIATAGALAADHDLLRDVRAAGRGNVLGTDVISDAGQRLGKVTDVILLTHGQLEVVGYEIAAGEALAPRGGGHVFVPLPDTLAVSGEALMVPAAVGDFVTDDLAGFGAAVQRFRQHLRSAS